jgi:hypothetical protein
MNLLGGLSKSGVGEEEWLGCVSVDVFEETPDGASISNPKPGRSPAPKAS